MGKYTVRIGYGRIYEEKIEADSLEEAQLIAEDIALYEREVEEDIEWIDVR